MDQFEDLIIKFLEQVFSSQEEFSDEELEMLFEVAQEALSFIKERKEAPIESAVPQLDSNIYPSSNINAFAFDPKNGKLFVKFNGKDVRDSGPIYQYENVPEVIFELFKKGAIPARTNGSNKWGKWWKGKVPSLGSSMFSLIKSMGYSYKKLS